MFKTMLNELCQKRKWAMPEYRKRVCEGPDHSSLFRASVTVNGVAFDGPEETFRTLKEAQNEAARLAVNFFEPSSQTAAVAPPPSTPPAEASRSDAKIKICGDQTDSKAGGSDANETRESFKILLQDYAQKKGLGAPVYDTECLTNGHGHHFKASVTINGKTFETPKFFPVLNDAEQAVARLAMQFFSPEENLEVDGMFYQNPLGEMARKEGLSMPVYETVGDGPPHMRTFVCTVVIDGEKFQGEVMKTKKRAENSAAKVAWMTLQERKLSRVPSGLTSRFQTITIEDVPHPSEETVAGDSGKGMAEILSVSAEMPVEIEERSTMAGRIVVFPREASNELPEGATIPPLSDEVDGMFYQNPLGEMARKEGLSMPVYETVGDGPPHMRTFVCTVVIDGEKFQGEVMKTKKRAENSAAKVAWMTLQERKLSRALSGLTSRFQTITIEDVPHPSEETVAGEGGKGMAETLSESAEMTVEIEERSTMAGRRIVVFPREASNELPKGATILPFSDEVWVAGAIQ